MKGRFNESGQFMGMDSTHKCTACKKEFVEYWDSFKGTRVIETPCECGENKKAATQTASKTTTKKVKK